MVLWRNPSPSDLGVTKKQSHNWQKLASLDDDVFERRVADAKRQAVKSVEMTAAERGTAGQGEAGRARSRKL
jgi:hypothetical protein